MSAPRVAVVVVTYNSADVLPQCLESLRDGGADGVELTDVVVVDNASDDASTEIAKATDGLPISVVQLTENVGYAAGLNAGVTALRNRPPDAVMVVNPDCRLRPGTLATLARALQVPGPRHRRAAPGQPGRHAAADAAPLPTVLGAFAEAILGGRIADRLGLGELIFTDGPHDGPGPAAWVTGRGAPDGLGRSWRPSGPGTRASCSTARRPSTCCARPTTAGRRGTSRRRWSSTRAASPAPDRAWPRCSRSTRSGCSGAATARVEGRAYTAGVLLGMLFRAAAGQRTARASVAALLFPSRRITSLAQLR